MTVPRSNPVAPPPDLPGAACAILVRFDGMSPDLWFPSRNPDPVAMKVAKKVCAECPAQAACLEFALSDPRIVGIWGGYHFRTRASHAGIVDRLRR